MRKQERLVKFLTDYSKFVFCPKDDSSCCGSEDSHGNKKKSKKSKDKSKEDEDKDKTAKEDSKQQGVVKQVSFTPDVEKSKE